MAISASLIGRLGGGAEVDEAPTTGATSSDSWTSIHTVTVPDGGQWLISAYGDLHTNQTGFSRYPGLRVRETAIDGPYGSSQRGVSTVVAGPATVDVEIRQRAGTGTTTFTGTVYTVPLPD